MKGELVKRQDRWDLYGSDGAKIASSAENPFNKLSIENCEAIANGYDLDELAEERYGNDCNTFAQQRDGFKEGFKKAIELLGDKKYNYGHLDKMFTCGALYQDSKNRAYCFDNVLSKFEKNEWNVEIETEPMNLDEIRDQGKGFLNSTTTKPKLDKNNCLILKPIKNV